MTDKIDISIISVYLFRIGINKNKVTEIINSLKILQELNEKER